MVELAHILTRTETLLESNMLGILILCYGYLVLILFVSFLNIYSLDKYEFKKNKQKCITFKYKMFFIFMYSKQKKIVSIKTFVLEMIGYLLFILLLVLFFVSLKQNVTNTFIIFGVVSFLIFSFGCVTGSFYRKTQKHKLKNPVFNNFNNKQ